MSDEWNGWGVSVKGPLHKINKIPNQDSWSYRKLSWGSIGVVSDGLGSHPYSHIGSKAVCNAVIEAAKISFSNKTNSIKDINPHLFFKLINSIWLMKIHPYLPGESSATCLFAIQKNDKILLAQLGDGLIVAISDNESVVLNNENDFSNITNSMSENFCEDNWNYKILNSNIFASMLMVTDGISDDLIKDKIIDFSNNICDEYNNYDPTERYYRISNWLRNWPTPKHTDDKTLVCINKIDKKKRDGDKDSEFQSLKNNER